MSRRLLPNSKFPSLSSPLQTEGGDYEKICDTRRHYSITPVLPLADLWPRLITDHMGKHIAGNPGIVVQNMPGAGGVIAANYVYNIAKPDGLSLGTASPSIYMDGDRYFCTADVGFIWCYQCGQKPRGRFVLFGAPNALRLDVAPPCDATPCSSGEKSCFPGAGSVLPKLVKCVS